MAQINVAKAFAKYEDELLFLESIMKEKNIVRQSYLGCWQTSI